jgi:hypothetical protein
MAGESKKTEGTFGSFLELINSEPTFPNTPEQNIPNEELEDGIVDLLALLKHEGGGPILMEDLYRKCSLRLRLFGEAIKVMNQEKLIVIDTHDQVSLAPGIREQL